MTSHDLLAQSREIAAIAQAGLAYSRDPYDRERFQRLLELSGEILRVAGGPATFAWPVEMGYPTPKVDVRAVVFRRGEVLLVKEASSGLWTLPGGWADVNLTPAENVEKECREESGYEVKARKITAIYDRDRAGYPRNPHAIYKIFFLCELCGGEARISLESTEVGFFPRDGLPELDPHRAKSSDIELAWQHFQDQTLPVSFH